MKRLVLVILAIGVFLLGACTPAPVSEPPISPEEQAAQELFEAASEYLHQFTQISELTKSRLTEAENVMRDGHFTLGELGRRIDLIFFAEAATIDFLNSLPEYSLLHSLMWENGKPPKLDWSSTVSHARLEDFKRQHILAFPKIEEHLNQLEVELGIELEYRPRWLK